MNVRLFLALSSFILMGWMATSYLSTVPLEGYLSEQASSTEKAEVAFNPLEYSLVNAQ